MIHYLAAVNIRHTTYRTFDRVKDLDDQKMKENRETIDQKNVIHGTEMKKIGKEERYK